MHRAYARKEKVIVPSLEEYESRATADVVIPLKLDHGTQGQPAQPQAVKA